MQMERLEALMQAWLNMSFSIRVNRMLNKLSLNEIIVCNLLLRARAEGEALTATDLCARMRLLKSQMNKILMGMEEKGLVCRERSRVDHRKICILLREENMELYYTEHEQILSMLRAIEAHLGAERTEELALLLEDAVCAVEEHLSDQKEN
ncbi:MAG: MarR family transcriptional regulator [Ruminococcaceae bacterium]|nr:MarR family transcriptional regulator [Oscillospiraceae bacterium]